MVSNYKHRSNITSLVASHQLQTIKQENTPNTAIAIASAGNQIVSLATVFTCISSYAVAGVAVTKQPT